MSDIKTSLFQKLIKNPQTIAMATQMFNSMPNEGKSKFMTSPSGLDLPDDAAASIGYEGIPGLLNKDGVNASQLGSLALGAAKAHPFKTAGLVGLGAGNIGGLTDNDKFGGQLGGLALGGLGSYLAKANPYAAAMMTMGGGALGSLFDKLRAKKELEKQQGYANAGNPIAMMNRM